MTLSKRQLAALFPIPDQVADEWSRRELDGDYDDYHGGADGVFDDFSFSGLMSQSRVTYHNPKPPANRNIECEECGYTGLMWANTPHGARLVYGSGPLEGKIHACEHENY